MAKTFPAKVVFQAWDQEKFKICSFLLSSCTASQNEALYKFLTKSEQWNLSEFRLFFFLPQALPRSLVPENLITQVQILSRESVPKGSPVDIEQRVNLKGSWWKMLSKWSMYNIFEKRLWVMTSCFYQSLVALRTCFKDKMMRISWRWQSRAFSKHFIS